MFSKGQSTKIRYCCPHCKRYIYIWEINRFFNSNTDSHNGRFIIEADYLDVATKLYKILRTRGLDIDKRVRCAK
jgi:hypothetical protein